MACVVSTLLYGSESWTPHSGQEKRLSTFHMRCLRRILGISLNDHFTNSAVLERAGVSSMFTLLKQRRLRWLGHVSRMDDGRIPKDLLYGELASGKRPTGRPQLRLKDVCKRDLKALAINPNGWEAAAADRDTWRCQVKHSLAQYERDLTRQAGEKHQRRKQRASAYFPASVFTCARCGRDCHSRIGLHSQSRSGRCSRPDTQGTSP